MPKIEKKLQKQKSDLSDQYIRFYELATDECISETRRAEEKDATIRTINRYRESIATLELQQLQRRMDDFETSVAHIQLSMDDVRSDSKHVKKIRKHEKELLARFKKCKHEEKKRYNQLSDRLDAHEGCIAQSSDDIEDITRFLGEFMFALTGDFSALNGVKGCQKALDTELRGLKRDKRKGGLLTGSIGDFIEST